MSNYADTIRFALIGHWTSTTEQANDRTNALTALDYLEKLLQEAKEVGILRTGTDSPGR